MNCNDESTAIDVQRPHADGATAGSGGGSADELNLYPHIDRDQVFGLNLSDPAQAKVPIKPWDRREDSSESAESGVDDTFVITVPFTCSVRLKSILLNAGRGDFSPRRVRAYVNRPSGIDFDEIHASSSNSIPEFNGSSSSSSSGPSATAPAITTEPGSNVTLTPMQRPSHPSAVGNISSGKPQADFALLEDAVGVTEYPLSISRFSHTSSISVVFSDARGGDISRVYYLGFRGTALQLKQDPGDKLEIGAANAADAPMGRVREQYGAAQNTNVR